MPEYINKIRTASGDLPINYEALANLPTISNPNLLINSDFRNPINQRGETNYSIPAYTYTIDRWKVLSKEATLSVNDGYIKLSSIAGPSYFIQKFESIPVNDYVTVSINVKSVTGVINVYVGSTEKEECFSIYSAGIATYTTSVKFTDFIQLNIEAVNDAQVELYWAKAELGSTATQFVPRLYDEELIFCRRYYRKYWTSMLFPQFYQNQYCGFMFDVPMRKDPTVKTFSILSTSNNSSIGQSVEVYAQGVYKFHVTSGYAEKAVLVPMLELDAEIY